MAIYFIIPNMIRRLFVFTVLISTLSLFGAASEKKTIVFFGDSLTVGYGLNPEKAYPSLIQKKIDAKGWGFSVVNAGVSGDTTSAGIDRLAWVLKQPVEILVIALGGNDGLRGIPPETMKANLQKMIDLAREKQPNAALVLAGMKMAPNYGPAFTKQFSAVFPDLAKKNDLVFIPFLLKGVGGIPEMNLSDRIHPNEEGQKIIAETVWSVLKPLLEKTRSPKN